MLKIPRGLPCLSPVHSSTRPPRLDSGLDAAKKSSAIALRVDAFGVDYTRTKPKL